MPINLNPSPGAQKYIMACGDSKTAIADGRWRILLQDILRSENKRVNWIGAVNGQTNGDPIGMQSYHSAISGATVGSIRTLVAGATLPAAPDIITIWLGTNDLRNGIISGAFSEATLEASYLGFIGDMHARWSSAKIVCLNIDQNFAPDTYIYNPATFNAFIAGLPANPTYSSYVVVPEKQAKGLKAGRSDEPGLGQTTRKGVAGTKKPVKLEGMLTKTPPTGGTGIALKALLDVNHAMVKLSAAIDWDEFTTAFGAQYHDDGRPSVPIRVMVGLHYLKYLFNESDEGVVKKWVENPYWQYFCGCETFQHDLPCHPSSLSKWRKRIGEAGAERLFKVVLETAMKSQAFAPDEIKQVTVDTTVQDKAIAFPTDARLAYKARRALVRAAKAEGIKLRQTYERASKAALFQHSRYATARQYKRAMRQTRKLQVFLGRVIRDIRRKYVQPLALPASRLATVLDIAHRIHTQRRHDTAKCYSVHAPEVECIAKGKVNHKYEFGCKVAVATTTHTNWIVGIQAHHGNPYDGATLTPSLSQVEQMTGVKPEQALVDQGFRGHDHHPPGVKVLIVRATAKVTATVKTLFKRRSAIEPIIGHTKFDHGLCRNHLHGILGDKMNALFVGCGFNLAKLLRFFAMTPLTSQPA